MTIQQLKYFIEVCNTGTMTEAAANLFVSQPSVTIAIKELEQEMGTNLLRRINKRLHITPEGEYLLSKAIKIVSEIESLKNEVIEMAGSNKKIKLGLPAQVGAYLMPIILDEFTKLYPNIVLEIIEYGSYHLIELLEKEEIDLVVMSDNDVNKYTFDVKQLFTTDICFITNISNKYKENSVSIQDIANEKLVLLNKNYVVTKLVTDAFKKGKISPDIVMTTRHLSTVKNLISYNLASSFMIKEVVAYDDNMVAVPLKPAIQMTMSVVTKKDKIKSGSVNKLIDFLVSKTQK